MAVLKESICLGHFVLLTCYLVVRRSMFCFFKEKNSLFKLFSFFPKGVPLQYFAGILTAHIFYYITEVMPRVSGKPSFLRTPAFLYRILPPNYNSRVGVQFRQQQHAWGNAHQLR